MTEKEYEEGMENITKLYMQTLKDYHNASEQLRKEREWNKQNIETIKNLEKTIERYEKIIDRVSIQVIDCSKPNLI